MNTVSTPELTFRFVYLTLVFLPLKILNLDPGQLKIKTFFFFWMVYLSMNTSLCNEIKIYILTLEFSLLFQASGISLFKQKTASNSESASAASDSKISAQTLNKSSPPKRMISQKALLSRQPLSKQLNNAKSKTSPTKSAQKSSGNAEPKGGGSSTDILSHQRISRVTSENISRTNVKATSVMLTDGKYGLCSVV